MPTQDQLIDVVDVTATLARNIALKRALTAVDVDPALNFWRMSHGNSMDMAVLTWCKLFGADHAAHNATHWKNVVDQADHATFRAGLWAHVGMNEAAWRAYWDAMKNYRDFCVAHLDVKRRVDVKSFPDLEPALASATFYYQHVIGVLRGIGFTRYPDDLRRTTTRS